jgi:hypothetical protein
MTGITHQCSCSGCANVRVVYRVVSGGKRRRTTPATGLYDHAVCAMRVPLMRENACENLPLF